MKPIFGTNLSYVHLKSLLTTSKFESEFNKILKTQTQIHKIHINDRIINCDENVEIY